MCASAVSPPGIVETLAHTYPLHSFFSPCFGLVFWNERSFLFCKPLCISNVVSFRFFVYNRFLKKGNGGFRQIVPYKHTHTTCFSSHPELCGFKTVLRKWISWVSRGALSGPVCVFLFLSADGLVQQLLVNV